MEASGSSSSMESNNNATLLSQSISDSNTESNPSSTLQIEPNKSTAHPADRPSLDTTVEHSNSAVSPSDELPVEDDTFVESSRDSNHIPNPPNEEPPQAKIVAGPSSPDDDDFIEPLPAPAPHHRRRPSLDDVLLSSSSPPARRHRRLGSMDQIVDKVLPTSLPRSQSTSASKAARSIDFSKGQIDTEPPFVSVKAAVSKFGGMVDWKAHRVQTAERRKYIEQKLEKAREKIPLYKKQCEVAEDVKMQLLKELDSTNRQIEELKIKLEAAEKEEEKAKQDAYLAKITVEKMEQGITDEASFTARAQLEITRAKHKAAIEELNTAKDELEQITKEYNSLLAEKDEAVRKAEEADAVSKEAEKSIEEMTAELLVLKQSLESAHSEHLEAEDRRIEEVMEKELESINWERGLTQIEEELVKLNEEMASTEEIQSKLGEATESLQCTKAEIAAYMESKSGDNGEEVNLEDLLMEPKKRSHEGINAAVTAAKKELAEVKQKIEKAADEVKTLEVLATSLKSELDEERSKLAAVQKRERTASKAIKSLDAELDSVKSEIMLVRMEAAGENKFTKADLPKRLQQAAQEADDAKTLDQAAHDKLQKAEEEVQKEKAGASAMESKLPVTQNERKAARASEKLTLAKSKSAQRNSDENSADEVALPLGEYYELTRRVNDAEEQANMRVAAAVSQVAAAKESESLSLNKLQGVTCEIIRQKEALELALLKAEKAEAEKLAAEQELQKWKAQKAEAEKLAAEQELQKWKAEHEQKERAVESVPAPLVTSTTPMPTFEQPKRTFGQPNCLGFQIRPRSSQKAFTRSKSETESSSELKFAPKKKKRSFFRRFFVFLSKKKTTPAPSAQIA